MKALAIVGFVFAVLSLIGGFILSLNANLPLQGFSGVIAGIAAGMMFALPSAALLGIAKLLKSN
jgi:hypothetical protein